MKVAVISDTHIPRKKRELPEALLKGIVEVDMIIHAGDISKDYVIYELEEIAPVVAVAGNTDDDYVHSRIGRKKIIDVCGCRIGIIHGDGDSLTTLERVKTAFREDKPDCIIFGHSHIPFNEVIGGVLYFNPGSPTDKRTQKFYSYGILVIDNGSVSGEIVYFL